MAKKNRSSAHRKAQKAGKVRDLFTCQVCGTKGKDKVQGHHIFDHMFSGAADADNIITLCNKCHKNVHNNLLDIFKF